MPSSSRLFSGIDLSRRGFFQTVLAGTGMLALPRLGEAALPKTKITRIRYYKSPVDAASHPISTSPRSIKVPMLSPSKPKQD